MPPSPPRVEGLETAAVYRPADPALVASGDFYDLFEARDGWIAVVGDVSGNGAGAAVVTGLLRHSLRAHAVHEPSPARLLDHLNRAVFEAAVDELATLVCARLRRRGAHFEATLVSAGHPPPLVRRAAGDVEPVPLPGTILGAVEEPLLEERTRPARPGRPAAALHRRPDRGARRTRHARRAGRRRAAERHRGPEEAVRALESLALETQAGVPSTTTLRSWPSGFAPPGRRSGDDPLRLRVGPAGRPPRRPGRPCRRCPARAGPPPGARST